MLKKVTDPQYWVKQIRAAWGSEFRNKNLQVEIQQRIQLKETVSRHSETDTIAERTNQPILAMSGTALIVTNMPKENRT